MELTDEDKAFLIKVGQELPSEVKDTTQTTTEKDEE